MKSSCGVGLGGGTAPVQLTVMPCCPMFSVWLTVTFRFLNSLSINDSGDPEPAARSEFGFSSGPPSVLLEPVIGWFDEFSRPLVQFTVTAEVVEPTPVIWL